MDTRPAGPRRPRRDAAVREGNMLLVILVAAASLLTTNFFLRDIDDPKRNAQDEIEAAYRDSSYVWEAYKEPSRKKDTLEVAESGLIR